MSDSAVAQGRSARCGLLGPGGGAVPAGPGTRRTLQLALAGIWLLDALLQFQSFMFSKGFSQMLASTAAGNPAVLASPISWQARLVGHSAVLLNAIFAAIQLLIAIAIACRPTVRLGLAVSIAWSLGVWWFGEGLGGVLAGTADPVSGAPGAVIIYALLGVLLWPADRDRGAPFAAGRAVGARAARALWLVLWLSLAYFALLPANRAPQALHDLIAGMASGEPGWLAALDRAAASLVANQGLAASLVLAAVLALVAAGVYLPAPVARGTLLLAIVVAAVTWVFGEAFGSILTGSATDPGSGPLLIVLALAYWPARPVAAAAPGGPAAAGKTGLRAPAAPGALAAPADRTRLG